MNPEHLLRHFDRISEAPDAIPCLRRFILNRTTRHSYTHAASCKIASCEVSALSASIAAVTSGV